MRPPREQRWRDCTWRACRSRIIAPDDTSLTRSSGGSSTSRRWRPPTLLALLKGERRTDLPVGLIHGDLFIDNVLFEGDALVALLDFEQASWGRLAYDLAVTLLAFAFGREDLRLEVTGPLMAGYATLRPLTAVERDGFGAELRFAACRFAVTRITDVYLKRTAGGAPGKDFRRYLHRLARVKQHLAANDGLLALP
jgi:Ser/Thr protein kinase RdoA (MazF antagonist)